MTTPNDPLAGMKLMHIWRDCVWAARIHPHAKLVLLALGRFMDGEGQGCSMSYSQLAYDCNLDERTVKRLVQKLKDVWLHKITAGGRLIPGVGRENLYNTMFPPSVVDAVRADKLRTLQSQTGVAINHPGGARGKVERAHKSRASHNRVDRGGPQTHVHCTVEGGRKQSRQKDYTTDSAAIGAASAADATNVIPFRLQRLPLTGEAV